MDDDRIAFIAKALANPARVRIVKLLAAQAECRGAEVFTELPLAQSTISEHLRFLKDAGLVTCHSVGTSMVYCLVPGVLAALANEIAKMAEAAAACGIGREECPR